MLLSSHGYKYNVIYEHNDDYKEIELIFISLKKQPYPCLKFQIPYIERNETHAILHHLNYYPSFSLKAKQLGKNQSQMLQVALKYMLDRFPYIQFVEITDETFIDLRSDSNPLITSRRLLLGEMGWYQEYLNAIPSRNTMKLIEYLQRDIVHRDIVNILLDNPEANNVLWWTPINIRMIADKIKIYGRIFGTTWVIHADVIKNYDVSYEIKNSLCKHSRRTQNIIKNSKCNTVFYHMIRSLK